MSDRLSLAAEVKQLQADQERRAAEWKEAQAVFCLLYTSDAADE